MNKKKNQIERIEITQFNLQSWTLESTLLKPLDLHPEASRPGGVQVGDIVWLAKRRKHPDVSHVWQSVVGDTREIDVLTSFFLSFAGWMDAVG